MTDHNKRIKEASEKAFPMLIPDIFEPHRTGFIMGVNSDFAVEYAASKKRLQAVEVCEIGQIKVNAILGKTIFDTAAECLFLVNLLNISVQLYWNGKYINIYKSDTVSTIIDKSLQ